MRRKLRNRIAAVCLAAAPIGLFFWLLTPPEHNLFKRAQIVEPREDFVFPARPSGTRGTALQVDWPYCWLEPQTLLTLHSGAVSLGELQPRIVDLTSGLPLSNGLFADFPKYFPGEITIVGRPPGRIIMGSKFQMSPDGAWMLASRSTNVNSMAWGEVGCVAVRADIKRQVTWRTPGAIESSAWMRDSRHWAGLLRTHKGYAVRLFDVDGPSDTQSLSFDLKLDLSAAPALAGTLPDGRLLAIAWDCTGDGCVHAARFFPDAEAEHPQNLRIPVPCGNYAQPIVPPILSPDGSRLAWFVFALKVPPGWPVTRRFWTFLKKAPSGRIGLWTTRPDGADAREVGSYTPRDQFDRPTLLQWTPDGKSLSFRHQGALNKVPST